MFQRTLLAVLVAAMITPDARSVAERPTTAVEAEFCEIIAEALAGRPTNETFEEIRARVP